MTRSCEIRAPTTPHGELLFRFGIAPPRRAQCRGNGHADDEFPPDGDRLSVADQHKAAHIQAQPQRNAALERKLQVLLGRN